MTQITYNVVDHFDVWGNKRDGWEINDSMSIGKITLPENHTYADVIRALKKLGYLKKTCRVNQFHFDEFVDGLTIESKSEGYKPLCTLYRIDQD